MPATLPDLTNATDWTDGLLDQLRQAVATEQERRYLIATAEAQAKDQAAKFEQAVKNDPAKTWAAGAVIGPGQKVTEDGKEYRNVSGAWLSVPPSVYPMGYQLTNPPKPNTAPAWKTGTAYKAGDQVSYGGKVYKVLQPHTSQADWTPPAVAALYALA